MRRTGAQDTDGGTATMDAPAVEDAQGELLIEIPRSAMQLDIQYIPHELIFPDPQQPRVQADDELRASIAAGGIRQPITVRPQPNSIGMYEIIDGERRWRGSAGVQSRIPCVVRLDQEEDVERLRTQLVANTGKPLTAVEEARAIQTLYQARGGSIAELAQFLGKPVSTISQRLNLMALGPWLELIQQGLIKYTHAVEVLFAYRGCPDAVHQDVIETLARSMNQLEPEELSDGSWCSSADSFRGRVDHLFKKSLYPIAKRKHDEHPLFNTKSHDSECDCGGIELEDYNGKRRYCGNPEWWQPLKKAAVKAEKAKAAASPKSGASAPAVRAKVYAPEGSKTLTAKQYQEPKGYLRLVSREGKWALPKNHEPQHNFDPTTATFEPQDLGLHDGALYVRAAAPAVAAAQSAWQEHWQRRLDEFTREYHAAIGAAAEGCVVRKESAGRVLAALVYLGSVDFEFEEQFDDVIRAAGVVPVDLSGVHYHDKRAAVIAWTQTLTPTQAAAVLVGMTVSIESEITTPSQRLEKALQAEVARIQKLKTPFSKAPKKGKGKAEQVSAVDEGDDDGDDLEESLDGIDDEEFED